MEKLKEFAKKITIEKLILGIVLILSVFVIGKSVLAGVLKTATYKTTVAELGTRTISTVCEGYVLRDESRVVSSNGENVVSVVSEGTKVEKGGEVARKFDVDADFNKYVEEKAKLEKELAYLSNLKTNKDDYVSNIPAYNRNILNGVYSYSSGIENGDYSVVSDASDNIREYLTVKNIVLGDTVDVEGSIAECERQLSAISQMSVSYDPVRVNYSGYYFRFSDGLEESFTKIASYEDHRSTGEGNGDERHGDYLKYSIIREITCEDIDNLLALEPDSSSSAGKCVHNTCWYLVVNMSTEYAAMLSENSYYKITFRDSAAGAVSMRVDQKNENPDTRTTAVVFSSRSMNKDIAKLRHVTAEICIETFTGIIVPKTAVHYQSETEWVDVKDEDGNPVMVNGEQKKILVSKDTACVFVSFNNVSKLREIEIIYSDDKIFLAKNETDNSSGRYLKLNDKIFIEGSGLTDEGIVGNGYFN